MDAAGDSSSDADLVARTLAGQREAFALLYDRYARLVRAIAFDGSGDLSTVHDLTQDCFLRAFQQLSALRDRDHFARWLVGIARMVVREHRRRRQPGPLRDGADLVACESLPRLEDIDEMEHTLRLVAQLPEQERLAVHHFFLNGRDAVATGQLLNLSRSGTYALLQRACARLAGWLEGRPRRREGKP
jgi:RNA polymerase sigma-70 factor (ECF subfamily)